MRWNDVTPFALTRPDPADVYLDPGSPPRLGEDDAAYPHRPDDLMGRRTGAVVGRAAYAKALTYFDRPPP